MYKNASRNLQRRSVDKSHGVDCGRSFLLVPMLDINRPQTSALRLTLGYKQSRAFEKHHRFCSGAGATNRRLAAREGYSPEPEEGKRATPKENSGARWLTQTRKAFAKGKPEGVLGTLFDGIVRRRDRVEDGRKARQCMEGVHVTPKA
jgi:hypothetical protein